MTEQEKKQIIEEVEQSILEKMKGTVVKEDTHSVLKKTREKWFTLNDSSYSSIMYKIFGSYVYWAVWDCIRKLTCFICGTSYVRNIKDTEFANEVADALCATVYDFAIRYREQKNSPATDQSNKDY